MNRQQSLDVAWRRCVAAENAARDEDRACRRRGGHTKMCWALVRDARKLKAEYEKLKALGSFNPLSIRDGLKMQQEKIIGDLSGRNGPDTHHGVHGDKNRHWRSK